VQPVGQLDDKHPQVLGHGHEHLAQVLGLDAFVAADDLGGLPGDLAQLGYPLHQLGHLRTEPLLDLLVADVAVLLDVVQEGGGYRVAVQLEGGDGLGSVQGVGDDGIARAAELAGVTLGGELVRALDLGHRIGRQVFTCLRQQRPDDLRLLNSHLLSVSLAPYPQRCYCSREARSS